MTGNYLGSYFKGNYVWGGAMNLTWNELNDNILHEKLQLKTDAKILCRNGQSIESSCIYQK